ncbi:hypothetical protein OROMI_016926 [Orobanche minor]
MMDVLKWVVANTLLGLHIHFWMANATRFLLGSMNGVLGPIKYIMRYQIDNRTMKQRNKYQDPDFAAVQAVETLEPEQAVVNSKGTARRKLSLPDDKRNDKINKDGNEIAAELPKHPSQAVKKSELGRIKRVQENKAKFDELGLGKYGTDPNPPTVQKQKGKDKVISDDEYVLESEHESNDSSKMTWFLKKLGEANPTLQFDIGDFYATFSSDQDFWFFCSWDCIYWILMCLMFVATGILLIQSMHFEISKIYCYICFL